ncbi:MAG: DNA-binding protein WhiA [Peptoniphilus sp.]|nr:DNA-binding protein WhiA [Peptoniphilus sp.]MDD7363255.1 DNA-binding protein WhiA [Bacillota bacterium]MDY6045348.1 DNA-binding protein WhiA [Peptoniphilus sp.]
MSFSKDVKNELARVPMEDMAILQAELAGYVRTCGVVRLSKGLKIGLSFHTENASVARRIVSAIKRVFGSDVEVSATQSVLLKKNKQYKIRLIDEGSVKFVLMDSDFLRPDNVFQMHYPVDPSILRDPTCIRAYIRASFLGAGSVTSPTKGYHLEFVTHDEAHGKDLIKWLKRARFDAKGVFRKDDYIVYIKEAEKISDLLAYMGANRSVLNFESARVVKDVRNNVNRLVNCETANLSKTVDASTRQVRDIHVIEEMLGFEQLPEDLSRLAEARMRYPEATLSELGKVMQPPMSKSGVNHRFKKMHELAEKLRGV